MNATLLKNTGTGLIFGLLSVLSVFTPVNGQPADSSPIAMIGKVVGSVVVQNTQGQKIVAKPFTAINQGDQVLIPESGNVQIIYLKTAQEENWQNSKVFKVGATESEPIQGKPTSINKVAPQIMRLLPSLPQQLSTSNVRTGMVRIRGLSAERYADIHAMYQELKSQAPAHSLLAEVYMLSNLQRERDYERMNVFLNDLLQASPNDDGVLQLRDTFQPLITTALEKKN